jgi:hypothetical protein
VKRFFERAPVALAAVAALLLCVPTASSGAGLQDVTLSCSDGTNLQLALDTPTLTELTGAVTSINLYPAGDPALACDLSQSSSAPAATSDAMSASSGNPTHDYAVGGGQLLFMCEFGIGHQNVSFSAHVANDAPTTPLPQPKIGATFNTTFPPSSQAACPGTGTGHFVSKVDCLVVNGNAAEFTARITHGTHFFEQFEGSEIAVFAVDFKAANQPDEISVNFTDEPCSFTSLEVLMLGRGNINVHDAP